MLRKAYVEITDICNLACSFCPGTDREKRLMKPEEFGIIAAKLRPYTDYIYLHLMGEPLLHPRLGEILSLAETLGFRVIITTNGTLLSSRSELLLSSRAVHKFNVSLQSFEANPAGDLEAYISACADFAVKAAASGRICVLRLWNNNGLDTLNPQIRELLKNTFSGEWESTRSGLKLADRVWLENGDKFDWPDLSAKDYGEKCFCYGLRDQIGVLCDGTVVPCCLDHNGDIPLGNLLTDDMDAILSSPRAKAVYNGFSGRNAVEELCRHCGYARRFS